MPAILLHFSYSLYYSTRQATVELCEANNLEGVESKQERLLNHQTGSGHVRLSVCSGASRNEYIIAISYTTTSCGWQYTVLIHTDHCPGGQWVSDDGRHNSYIGQSATCERRDTPFTCLAADSSDPDTRAFYVCGEADRSSRAKLSSWIGEVATLTLGKATTLVPTHMRKILGSVFSGTCLLLVSAWRKFLIFQQSSRYPWSLESF